MITVILTVPDPRLEALLASTALLARLWPASVEDVKVLLQLLLLARPSLAEALPDGLVRVITPTPRIPVSHISLGYEDVILSGRATDRDGEPLAEPHLRPSGVWGLAVSDVAVDGRSALSRAAG